MAAATRLTDQACYVVGNRERGREPGRLDAEEVHHPGHAVHLRALDAKVGCGCVRCRDLGAYTGVCRLQSVVSERGPVGAYGRVELLRTLQIDRIVRRIHPLHIRTEARAPG